MNKTQIEEELYIAMGQAVQLQVQSVLSDEERAELAEHLLSHIHNALCMIQQSEK